MYKQDIKQLNVVFCTRKTAKINEQEHWRLQTSTKASFIRLDALALSVIATATWLAGWLAVRYSRYCIKTTKPIRKLFGPSGRPII